MEGEQEDVKAYVNLSPGPDRRQEQPGAHRQELYHLVKALIEARAHIPSEEVVIVAENILRDIDLVESLRERSSKEDLARRMQQVHLLTERARITGPRPHYEKERD